MTVGVIVGPAKYKIKKMLRKENFPKFSKSDSTVIYEDIRNLIGSWPSDNAFVSGAGSLRFKSRAGQIGNGVANDSPPLQHFFKTNCIAHAQ